MSRLSDLLNPESSSRASPPDAVRFPEASSITTDPVRSSVHPNQHRLFHSSDVGHVSEQPDGHSSTGRDQAGHDEDDRSVPARTSSPRVPSLAQPQTPDPPPELAHQTSNLSPVEPSPPIEHGDQLQSPTLAQYHYGSGSPPLGSAQLKRRRASPPPTLAPIRSLPQSPVQQWRQQPLPSLHGPPQTDAHRSNEVPEPGDRQTQQSQAQWAQSNESEERCGGADTGRPAVTSEQGSSHLTRPRSPDQSVVPKVASPEATSGDIGSPVRSSAPDQDLTGVVDLKMGESTNNTSREASFSRQDSVQLSATPAAKKGVVSKKAAPKKGKAATTRKGPKKRAPMSDGSELLPGGRSDTPASRRVSR